MTSYLQRQRKGVLQDLAAEAGIDRASTDDMKKDELFALLQSHLRDNKAALSSKPGLKEYYARVEAIESPNKRASSGANVTSDTDGKPPRSVRKRTTKVKEEVDSMDETSPATALATRTPALQRAAARVPLPPSPAVVTDAIERQTAIIKQNVERYWTKFGVDDMVDGAREKLSSVIAVHTLALLIEGIGLRRETLHLRYAFSTPAVAALNIPSYPVNMPDFFELLTAGFWGPTTLWTTTSLVVPFFFAYFINLTLKKGSHGMRVSSKSYAADPLTFNVAKALFTFLVFAQGVRFGGLFNDATVATVHKGLYGGYQSLYITSAIGVLVSLYDAALKK